MPDFNTECPECEVTLQLPNVNFKVFVRSECYEFVCPLCARLQIFAIPRDVCRILVEKGAEVGIHPRFGARMFGYGEEPPDP